MIGTTNNKVSKKVALGNNSFVSIGGTCGSSSDSVCVGQERNMYLKSYPLGTIPTCIEKKDGSYSTSQGIPIIGKTSLIENATSKPRRNSPRAVCAPRTGAWRRVARTRWRAARCDTRGTFLARRTRRSLPPPEVRVPPRGGPRTARLSRGTASPRRRRSLVWRGTSRRCLWIWSTARSSRGSRRRGTFARI